MERIAVTTAPEAIGPYSQAWIHNGMVYCSGQVPLIPGTKDLKGTTIEEQTEQVLQNLQAVLVGAGSSLQKVVKTTVFLKNFADFPRMNAVYAKCFAGHMPARSTVEVSRLPLDAMVEIEAIAVL